MKFIAKKILGLSYGIAAFAMISCSVFGADLSGEESLFNRLGQLVAYYLPHFQHPVGADETESTARDESLLQGPPVPSAREQSLAITPIPEIARGHKDAYKSFMKSKLVYRPNEGSDDGKIEFPFSSFVNPDTLEGTFDLSERGDVPRYLNIHTGFKRKKIPENAHMSVGIRSELWIVANFALGSAATASAKYREIIENWDAKTAPFALFYTWETDDYSQGCDYVTTKTPEQLSASNLHKNWDEACQTASRYHTSVFEKFYVEFYPGSNTDSDGNETETGGGERSYTPYSPSAPSFFRTTD